MNNIFPLAVFASLAFGCATAQDQAPQKPVAVAQAAAPAKSDCAPPPKELVVKDLEKGKGEPVAFRTAVLVHYTGWIYEPCAADHKGEKFDSSEGRPTPFGFMVGAGRVIKGWDEGLIGMQEGGKRLLVIPADKAYGARSPSPKIPANSTLVFEVNLIQNINAAQKMPPRK